MHEVLQRLLAAGPVLTDGAWGTQLQARGLALGEFPDRWNLTLPAAVEAVARAYVGAGSRVLLTNTFGSNRLRLEAHGMAGQVIELNRQGVLLSRRAAGDRALVFASMGPSGRLRLSGDVTVGEWEAAFAEQAAALAGAGADGLVVETMSDPDEAAAAVRAARSTGLPVVACMVFDSGRGRDRTMMGTTPEEAVQALTEAGADVIGANCGQGIEGFIPVCAALRAATKLPLWIKANAGLPTLADGRAVYRTTAERFADEIPALLEAGADFVGGCCGTTPEFIAEVSRRWSRPPSRPTSP